MNVELVYWLALGTGLVLLLVSLVAGDLFGFADVDAFRGRLPLAPVLFSALAAFGSGGLAGSEALRLGQGGSLAAGAAAALVTGLVTLMLFALLNRAETRHRYPRMEEERVD
ncbi:MAG TPA: hypothetical protein VM840_08965 [Actinomycetota bacterium]|nr:hypothetical protein [Actinomycetota bacterium]